MSYEERMFRLYCLLELYETNNFYKSLKTYGKKHKKFSKKQEDCIDKDFHQIPNNQKLRFRAKYDLEMEITNNLNEYKKART
jgi:hypothetical protein